MFVTWQQTTRIPRKGTPTPRPPLPHPSHNRSHTSQSHFQFLYLGALRRRQNGRQGREGGASYASFGNQLVLILWQLDLAGVEAVGFHDGEAMGLSVFHKPLSFPAGPLLHPGGSSMGEDVREPQWTSIPILIPQGIDSWRFLQSPPLPLSPPTPLSWTPHTPVVRQISHKGAAKDQDNGESEEEDNPHVPDIHSRVLVITVRVWVLRQREVKEGFLLLHKA